MRNLSGRELRLAVITGVALALGLTWFVARGRLGRLRELRTEQAALELDLLRQEGLLIRRPELLRSFQRVRAQLPRHPEGRDIKSELSRNVQSLAMRAGLRITSLTPETEEYLSELDLYQMAIRCTWEGSPERLVDFLHRMQQLGAVTDVRELRLRNRSVSANEVSGSFTLEFAYTRVPPEVAAPTAEGPMETSVDFPEPGESL